MDAVESAVRFVASHPDAAPRLGGVCRRRVLDSPFKFSVVYTLREDTVLVVAVWADRRNPSVLLERIAELSSGDE